MPQAEYDSLQVPGLPAAGRPVCPSSQPVGLCTPGLAWQTSTKNTIKMGERTLMTQDSTSVMPSFTEAELAQLSPEDRTTSNPLARAASTDAEQEATDTDADEESPEPHHVPEDSRTAQPRKSILRASSPKGRDVHRKSLRAAIVSGFEGLRMHSQGDLQRPSLKCASCMHACVSAYAVSAATQSATQHTHRW